MLLSSSHVRIAVPVDRLRTRDIIASSASAQQAFGFLLMCRAPDEALRRV